MLRLVVTNPRNLRNGQIRPDGESAARIPAFGVGKDDKTGVFEQAVSERRFFNSCARNVKVSGNEPSEIFETVKFGPTGSPQPDLPGCSGLIVDFLIGVDC